MMSFKPGAIESLIFNSLEPLTLEKIKEVLNDFPETEIQAAVQDLEQDRGLARAALAAENQDLVGARGPDLAHHVLEVVLPAEEHLPGADRVADDIRVERDPSHL